MNSFTFGISSSVLVCALSVICNEFAKLIGSSIIRVPAVLLLILSSVFIIFQYTLWWTKKTSFLFYASFFPCLLWSTFDLMTLVDLYLKPSEGFISEYILMDEPLTHNPWMSGVIVFDATVMVVMNFLVLYLIQKGRSIRNCLLFISTHFGFCGAVWALVIFMSGTGNQTVAKITVLTVPVLVYAPILITVKEPEFVLKGKSREFGINSTIAAVTKVLLILTLGILLGKILIVRGFEIGFWKCHDYTLNLLELERTKLFGQVHVTLYALLLLPSVLISLASLSGKLVSLFLWDMSVMQAACLASGQIVLISSCLFWEMPPELRGKSGDLIFWAINIIPIAGGILQLFHVSTHVYNTNALEKGK